MDKLKEVRWSSTLIASLLFGYLGIDKFILKKTKSGILKLSSFILGIVTIYYFENLLKIILLVTASTINFSKNLLISIGAGNILSTHIPKIVGLATITLLVMIVLICGISIFIWWIEDVIAIARKQDIDGIKWK